MDSVARADEVKGGRWGGKSCISSGWRSCYTEWVTSLLESSRVCLCAKRCWETGNKWACDVEFPFSLYTRVRPLLLNSERQAVQGCLQNECVCMCMCVLWIKLARLLLVRAPVWSDWSCPLLGWGGWFSPCELHNHNSSRLLLSIILTKQKTKKLWVMFCITFWTLWHFELFWTLL